jgi:hypothetical protein
MAFRPFRCENGTRCRRVTCRQGFPLKSLHHYQAAKCVEGIPRKLLNYLIINTLIRCKNKSY